MGLRRKLGSRSAIAHANADSKAHQRHACQQQKRRNVEWEAVEPVCDYPSAKEIFGLDLEKLGLPAGECFIPCGRSGALCAVDGVSFEHHLTRLSRILSWNWEIKKNKAGSNSRRKRSRKKPLGEFVINLTPAQNLFLSKLGHETLIRQRILSLIQPLVDEFKTASGRSVYGVTVHFDSSKVHINLYESRVSRRHRLVGKKGLQTLGAWSVGQYRLRKLGGASDKGCEILEANLERFKIRHGDSAEPLDIRLHRVLDEQFERTLTDDERQCLRDCEREYVQWKVRQYRHVSARRMDAEQLALEALQLLLRFLPPELQRAIAAARTVKSVLTAIDGYVHAVRSLTNEQLTPTRNLTPHLS